MSEATVWQPVPRLLAIWPAWVLAAATGSLLPITPNVLDLRVGDVYWSQIALNSWLGGAVEVVAAATLLSCFQYVVIRVLIRRESLAATMWIPASVIGAVVAFVITAVWQTTVPRYLISISAIAAVLPAAFPMVQVIDALFGVVVALCLGLTQGVVLSNIFSRRVVVYWVLANLLGALIAGLVVGIHQQEIIDWLRNQVNPDQGALTGFYITDTLMGAVVYAAVTGAALLILEHRRSRAFSANLPVRDV